MQRPAWHIFLSGSLEVLQSAFFVHSENTSYWMLKVVNFLLFLFMHFIDIIMLMIREIRRTGFGATVGRLSPKASRIDEFVLTIVWAVTWASTYQVSNTIIISITISFPLTTLGNWITAVPIRCRVTVASWSSSTKDLKNRNWCMGPMYWEYSICYDG